MGLILPEEHGGSGLDFVDMVVVLEEMGRVVLPGPFFSTVILAGVAIAEAGSAAQKKAYLPKIADGSLKATVAQLEPSGRWDADGIQRDGEVRRRRLRHRRHEALRPRRQRRGPLRRRGARAGLERRGGREPLPRRREDGGRDHHDAEDDGPDAEARRGRAEGRQGRRGRAPRNGGRRLEAARARRRPRQSRASPPRCAAARRRSSR